MDGLCREGHIHVLQFSFKRSEATHCHGRSRSADCSRGSLGGTIYSVMDAVAKVPTAQPCISVRGALDKTKEVVLVVEKN